MNSGLTSVDSGLQLDLEIALSGGSSVGPAPGPLQFGRRCVETSDDVTKETFTSTATICRAIFHALRSPLIARRSVSPGKTSPDGRAKDGLELVAIAVGDGLAPATCAVPRALSIIPWRRLLILAQASDSRDNSQPPKANPRTNATVAIASDLLWRRHH